MRSFTGQFVGSGSENRNLKTARSIYLDIGDRGGRWFSSHHCQKFDEKALDVIQCFFIGHEMRVNLQSNITG